MHWEGETLTVARRLPARFDVSAETILPIGNRARLAHQIRQDMWRRLQKLRGFAPVVQVTKQPCGAVHVKAGGALDGHPAPAQCNAEIATLLEAPELRARWVRFASQKDADHV